MTADHAQPSPSETKTSPYGVWIWLCGWMLAVVFVLWHARAVERYLDRVSATRFSAEALNTPMQRIPQYIAPDGQMWMRAALAMADNGDWRLRTSEVDNAPDGRPIYWNSAWAWWLMGCAKLRMLFTGEPLLVAMEMSSAWANVPLFIVAMSLASGWVWRRWGGPAGALLAMGLAGSRAFYGAFYPAYPDHHGLIAACVLGLLLGMIMAGAGWWRPNRNDVHGGLPKSERDVMKAVTISAICGAIGLWVSAASLVMTIAFTGIAGLAVSILALRARDSDAVCLPQTWRWWGRVGAVTSLGLYLLENFPDRLGMRLEANHPLYALSWWAAGEAMTAVLLWRQQRLERGELFVRLTGWGVAVLAAPLVIWSQGARVFAPADPFLMRIHSSIHEFESLPAAIGRAGWPAFADMIVVLMVACALGILAAMKRGQPGGRIILLVSGGVALVSSAQAFFQNRWLLTAGGPLIILVVVAMVVLLHRLSTWKRGVCMLVVAGLVAVPGPWILMSERRHVEQVRDVQIGETVQLLYRDIANALIKNGADRNSIILADPNASVGVGYYGELRTVGTLYWENRDGLKASADMLCARDGADAAARIHVQGVNYLVLVSTNDFLAEYDYALSGLRRSGGMGDLFGYRVLYDGHVPVWLRPLDYQVPAPLAPLGFKVELFAVDFDAPVSLAHERIGLHQLLRGRIALAEASFMASLATDSTRATPWLLQGRMMLADGRLQEAFNYIQAGIKRSPEDERPDMLRAASALFLRAGDPERAKALLSGL